MSERGSGHSVPNANINLSIMMRIVREMRAELDALKEELAALRVPK